MTACIRSDSKNLRICHIVHIVYKVSPDCSPNDIIIILAELVLDLQFW